VGARDARLDDPAVVHLRTVARRELKAHISQNHA